MQFCWIYEVISITDDQLYDFFDFLCNYLLRFNLNLTPGSPECVNIEKVIICAFPLDLHELLWKIISILNEDFIPPDHYEESSLHLVVYYDHIVP